MPDLPGYERLHQAILNWSRGKPEKFEAFLDQAGDVDDASARLKDLDEIIVWWTGWKRAMSVAWKSLKTIGVAGLSLGGAKALYEILKGWGLWPS